MNPVGSNAPIFPCITAVERGSYTLWDEDSQDRFHPSSYPSLSLKISVIRATIKGKMDMIRITPINGIRANVNL
jgi:hypothetical protein